MSLLLLFNQAPSGPAAISGTGALTVAALALAGSGQQAHSGTAAVTLTTPAITATAQQEIIARVEALWNYWTAYYHRRCVTLYDFAKKMELQ